MTRIAPVAKALRVEQVHKAEQMIRTDHQVNLVHLARQQPLDNPVPQELPVSLVLQERQELLVTILTTRVEAQLQVLLAPAITT